MSKRNLLVFIASVFAIAFAIGSVNAAVCNDSTTIVRSVGVEVDGIDITYPDDLSLFAGETIPVLVAFTANYNAEDVTIRIWITGEDDVESERFDIIAGNTYRKRVLLTVPSDIDARLNEARSLRVEIDAEKIQGGEGVCPFSTSVQFTAQRTSYNLEILNVDMQPEVSVGDSLVVDVVLKNRGSHFADDAFLKISIPELGLEERTYFGDLSPIDQDDPEKDDAVERRTYIRIPANAKPGLYDVQIEAFNSDSYDKVDRRVLVVGGAIENTQVVTAGTSRTFNTGETESYKMTIVNRGSVVRVFELKVSSPDNLRVETSDPLVVVPAGTSRTVEFLVNSNTRDEYDFSVDVLSDDGALIDSETFSANIVEGNGKSGVGIQANTTVLLTVILAIIFVVLLVVLIVLLTRKPESKEEYGESYY